jgi:hypothetical protein
LTPPDEGALHTPDHPRTGVGFAELVDITLGTTTTLPAWTSALQQWSSRQAATTAERRVGGPATNLELRALALVRERFGDVAEARDTLRRLAEVLDELDRPGRDDPVQIGSATSGTYRTPAKDANETRAKVRTGSATRTNAAMRRR